MLVNDIRGDGIKEGTVVRYNKQRALPSLQVVLEPRKRVQVDC